MRAAQKHVKWRRENEREKEEISTEKKKRKWDKSKRVPNPEKKVFSYELDENDIGYTTEG